MAMIERAQKQDVSEILSLQKLAYVSEAEIYNNYNIMPLKEDLATAEQSFEDNIVLKYVEEGRIVGSVRAYEKDGECFINKLMVHPEYRNRGIAQKLMEGIEKQFKGVTYKLFTGSRSTKNIALYEKLGYKGYKKEKLDVEDTVFLFMMK
ncbi:ribosomal protein S18 acetylase RimI-like enzyme [Geomicrobium halophilum]|uniref:Ribosomal protein S18 acetylase RimI-like enzyme n=1 Tax=Geomicrobium halophilum TaxID=549000 RepID=A0A841PT49_9BACL|nr:GNAT family N-acetyltransferase [Geomicrobium halophilum]MBB6449481.1 ribosomal protein S18 acetylase RimI-like enzyme [Geomicrobium halophilum]